MLITEEASRQRDTLFFNLSLREAIDKESWKYYSSAFKCSTKTAEPRTQTENWKKKMFIGEIFLNFIPGF